LFFHIERFLVRVQTQLNIKIIYNLNYLNLLGNFEIYNKEILLFCKKIPKSLIISKSRRNGSSFSLGSSKKL